VVQYKGAAITKHDVNLHQIRSVRFSNGGSAGITDVDDGQEVAEAPDDRRREEPGDHLKKKRRGRG
jgi:hypothetical protein